MKYEPDFFRENFYQIKIKNTNFGNLYINLILRKLCRDIYLPLGKWNKLNGERYGIINTGYSLKNIKMISGDRQREYYMREHNMMDTIWSLLNKIDTHYTTTAMIVHYIMEKYKIDLIFSTGIDNETMRNNRLSWELLEKYLILESKNILTPYGDNPDIFNEIMSYLAWTYFVGEITEYESINNFRDILGYKKFIKSKMGQHKDIKEGKDFQADNDYVQSKSFTTIIKDPSFISFPTVTSKGYEKVDMFSFWNDSDRSWFVFRNENVSENGHFTFRINSLIYPPKEEYLKNF